MKMLHVAQRYRSGTMGLFFAGLGFTYALATSGGSSTLSYNAASRAIGTVCLRPPTQWVTPSDLGFVVQASNYRRQLLVRFGIAPHTFQLVAGQTGLPATVSPDGQVNGVPSSTGRVDFTVNVQDFSTFLPIPTISRDFFFTVVANSTTLNPLPLTIINGPALPPAVTGEPYNFTIQANGGAPPYTYALADDASQQALPEGLALGDDGLLFGVPTTVPTTTTPFTVVAVDQQGNSVKQQFTLQVLQGPIQTDVIASSGSFRFSFGRDGSHDSLKLTLILNKDDLAAKNIRTKADLNNLPFGLQVGSITLPPGLTIFTGTDTSTSTATSTATTTDTSTDTTTDTSTGTGTGTSVTNVFNSKGQITVPIPIAQGGTFPRPKNQPAYKINLDPKTGILNVTFTGVSLIKGLGGNFRNFRNVIPVQVLIGAAVGGGASTSGTTSTDTSTQTGTGVSSVFYSKISLVQFDYRRTTLFGMGTTSKRDKTTPGGQFLITKVTGTEKLGSGDFDLVSMKFSGFLRLPGGKPLVAKAGDIVSVVVGGTQNSCIGSFPASSMENKNNILTFTNNDTTVPLHTLTIDNRKGAIYFDTNPVEAFRIFQQDTLVSGDPHKLPIIVTFASPDGTSVTVDAISSVTVFRRGAKLQNK